MDESPATPSPNVSDMETDEEADLLGSPRDSSSNEDGLQSCEPVHISIDVHRAVNFSKRS